MGIIRFAVKSSVAGGILYYSVQEGLWSKSDDSIKFYEKIYGNVAPYVKENVPKGVISELPQLPSVKTMSGCAGAMWNKGVITSIKFISELPTHVSNGVDSILSMPAIKTATSSLNENEKPGMSNKSQS